MDPTEVCNDSNLSYWLLWCFNQWWFWIFFLLGLTILACWPIILYKLEDKSFRINKFKIKYIVKDKFDYMR